jgi:hypothetical protein
VPAADALTVNVAVPEPAKAPSDIVAVRPRDGDAVRATTLEKPLRPVTVMVIVPEAPG